MKDAFVNMITVWNMRLKDMKILMRNPTSMAAMIVTSATVLTDNTFGWKKRPS